MESEADQETLGPMTLNSDDSFWAVGILHLLSFTDLLSLWFSRTKLRISSASEIHSLGEWFLIWGSENCGDPSFDPHLRSKASSG